MNVGDHPLNAMVDAAPSAPSDPSSSSSSLRSSRSEPGDMRVLMFASADLSLELEVMPGHVVGQIVPPGPGEVWVEAAEGGTFHAQADEVGFCDLSAAPRGSVRLRCETPAGQLVTDWVQL